MHNLTKTLKILLLLMLYHNISISQNYLRKEKNEKIVCLGIFNYVYGKNI